MLKQNTGTVFFKNHKCLAKYLNYKVFNKNVVFNLL
jgi:hypothetical protein